MTDLDGQADSSQTSDGDPELSAVASSTNSSPAPANDRGHVRRKRKRDSDEALLAAIVEWTQSNQAVMQMLCMAISRTALYGLRAAYGQREGAMEQMMADIREVESIMDSVKGLAPLRLTWIWFTWICPVINKQARVCVCVPGPPPGGGGDPIGIWWF